MSDELLVCVCHFQGQRDGGLQQELHCHGHGPHAGDVQAEPAPHPQALVEYNLSNPTRKEQRKTINQITSESLTLFCDYGRQARVPHGTAGIRKLSVRI